MKKLFLGFVLGVFLLSANGCAVLAVFDVVHTTADIAKASKAEPSAKGCGKECPADK